jgi:hypothetical protein
MIWPCNQLGQPEAAIISRYGCVRSTVQMEGGRLPAERNFPRLVRAVLDRASQPDVSTDPWPRSGSFRA